MDRDAAIKNSIQSGSTINTSGGAFHQGDETNINNFSQGNLSVHATDMKIYIQGAEGISTDLSKNFQDLKNNITQQYEERIKLLSEQIKDKQDKIELLAEKQSGDRSKYENEIEKLKIEYSKQISEYNQKESQFNNFLELIRKVDTSNTSENFKEALNLFIEGKETEAIDLLDDDKAEEELKRTEELENKAKEIEKKLEEAKAEALESKKKIAYEKFLKANFYALKGDFKTAELYHKKAVTIFSDNLTNYFYAAFLISQNRLKDSLFYFDRSIELAETESDKAKSLAMLGYTLLDMNELTKAEEKIDEARKIVTLLHNEEAKPTLTDVNIYIALGRISFEKHQVNEAIDYSQQALNIFDELDEEDATLKESWKAIACGNLGLYASLNKQIKDAIHFTNIYLDISNKLLGKDPRSPAIMTGVITSYNNLGRYYLEENNTELAEENFRKGIEQSEKFDDYPSIISKYTALLYTNLGRLYADTYIKIPEAKSFFIKAIDYRNRSFDNDFEVIKINSAIAILYMARIALYDNEPQQAKIYFDECLQIINNKPADTSLAFTVFEQNTYFYYGYYFSEQKQIAEAKEYWQKSISVYEKLYLDESEWTALILVESLINVAKNYIQLAKDAAGAFELYKKAFEIDNKHKINFPAGAVSTVTDGYGWLFKFYTDENTDEALINAETVLNRIEEILNLYLEMKKNYLQALYGSKDTLALFYFKKQDFEASEKWLDDEYEILELLIAEDAAKYKPELARLMFLASQNYFNLGDLYVATDKTKAQDNYDFGVNCLNAAKQIANEYAESAITQSMKAVIDSEIERINNLINAADASSGAQQPVQSN
jgi:tetratricopeptide (TPR) repeat protein